VIAQYDGYTPFDVLRHVTTEVQGLGFHAFASAG
jgi:hypothetical protein